MGSFKKKIQYWKHAETKNVEGLPQNFTIGHSKRVGKSFSKTKYKIPLREKKHKN